MSLDSRNTELKTEEVFRTITAGEITNRLNHSKKNTSPGPDRIEKKHIANRDMKEFLRILFNIILASKTQPTAWNINRKILIPKQGKDHSKIENYRPITISLILLGNSALKTAGIDLLLFQAKRLDARNRLP
jgi:hypothetical protein